MTVSVYAVNCICFCHLVKIHLCPCERYNLPPVVHPPLPPTPPHPTRPHSLIHAIHDIAVAVKVTKNQAVLASQQKYRIHGVFGGGFNLAVWQIT